VLWPDSKAVSYHEYVCPTMECNSWKLDRDTKRCVSLSLLLLWFQRSKFNQGRRADVDCRSFVLPQPDEASTRRMFWLL